MQRQKKLAVITGAGGDIGSETAIQLAKDGYTLSLVGRNKEKLAKVLAQVKEISPESELYVCDITKSNEMDSVVLDIINNQGNPSVLINGSAAFGDPKKIHEYTDEEIDEVYDTNIGGTTKFTKRIIPYMIRNGGGKIVNIGSTSYRGGYGGRLPYAVSKSGLEAVSQTNTIDYEKKGNIESYYVVPGPTEGERVTDVIQKRTLKSKNNNLEEMKKKFGGINGGELLKVSNTVDAIHMVLDSSLSVPSGATLVIDNYGIYDASHEDFSSKKAKGHEFIKGKKRKYLFLWKELSKKLQKNKDETIRKEFLKMIVSKGKKYAAIILFLFFAGKAIKIDQIAKDRIMNYKESAYNIKNYEYEIKKIALEKYGIESPEELLERANKTQDFKAADLYFQIGQEAFNNMKIYRDQGYKIEGIDLDKNIDI